MIIASLNEVVHSLLGFLNRKRKRAPAPSPGEEEASHQAERDPATVTYQSGGPPTYRLSGKVAIPPTRGMLTDS